MEMTLKEYARRAYIYRNLIAFCAIMTILIKYISLPMAVLTYVLSFIYLFAGMAPVLNHVYRFFSKRNLSWAKLSICISGIIIFICAKVIYNVSKMMHMIYKLIQSVINQQSLSKYMLHAKNTSQCIINLYSNVQSFIYDNFDDNILQSIGFITEKLYKSNSAVSIKANVSTPILIETIVGIVLFWIIFAQWDRVDDFLKHKISTQDQSDECLDMWRIVVQFHQYMTSWSAYMMHVNFIMFLVYSAINLIFGSAKPLICAACYAFSCLLPLFGSVIAWSIMICSTLFAGFSMLKIILFIIVTYGCNCIAEYIVVPHLISKAFNINIIFLVIGLLINIYLFGMIGLICNLPICLFVYTIVKEILVIENKMQ